MQARLTARDLAHAECIAAEAANKHLTRTLAVAREAVTRAASDVRAATVRLLGLEASRLAIEYREVEAEQDDRFLRLAQFDRYAAGVSPLPDHVMGALTADRAIGAARSAACSTSPNGASGLSDCRPRCRPNP